MHLQIEIKTNLDDAAAEGNIDVELGTSDETRDLAVWIKCLGTAAHVPVFLRADGWVRNTHMTKIEAELRVKEIWSLKSLGDQKANQQGKASLTLPEYFSSYLRKRFAGKQKKMLAFSYNFVAALETHIIDGDFALFMKVLFSEIHEKHYYDQMMMISNLKAHLAKLDVAEEGERDGTIDKVAFFEGLRVFFPYKIPIFMNELKEVVLRDAIVDDEVSIPDLMTETPDGFQSCFLECVRDQYLLEIDIFLREIHEELMATLRRHQEEKAAVVENKKALARRSSMASVISIPEEEEVELESQETKETEGATPKLDRAESVLSVLGGEEFEPVMERLTDYHLMAADISACLRKVDPNQSLKNIKEFMVRGSGDLYYSYDTRIDINLFIKNLRLGGQVNFSGHWKRLSS
jgi:hypothetical protein